MKKSTTRKPTVQEGLKSGAKRCAIMSSTFKGRIILSIVVGSMFWLFFIAPATCMKLEEAFPNTGVGVFVGLAMYFLWLLFTAILGQVIRRRRNIAIFGKPKPAFKEGLAHMKEGLKQTWEEINKD